MLRVRRQGPEALHFVCSPLEEGQEVQLKVDWERRFDHMQQHSGEKEPLYHTELRMHYYDIITHLFLFFPCLSGQHLITALADTLFGYKTTSWYTTTAHISFPVAAELVG